MTRATISLFLAVIAQMKLHSVCRALTKHIEYKCRPKQKKMLHRKNEIKSIRLTDNEQR